MKENGLEHISIGTSSESSLINADSFENSVGRYFPGDAFVVSFFDSKVLIGKWTGDSFCFHNDQFTDPKHIQRIRIFDENCELHAWRTRNGLKARFRKDDFSGNDTDVVVAHQVLFGTDCALLDNGFTRIFEKGRGTCLTLPFADVKVDEGGKRAYIKTHNYISYNEAFQATYCDCRFVFFTDGKENLK